jgi:hypothetical protein
VGWRRLLLPVIVLLIAISVLSATTSPDRVPTRAPTAAPEPPAPPAREVRASLPRTAPLHAVVGDVVRLVVHAPSADTVTLDALAVQAPVDRATPAELVFVADRPGRFRVRLRDAGEAIGTLVVSS